jgi:hypothetical protein
MEADQFRDILERHIVPMFTGATLQDRPESPAWKKRRAFLINLSEMAVRHPRIGNRSFVLRRSQMFVPSDAHFVENFVDHLSELDSVSDTPFIDDLINPIIRRTVAAHVAHGAESFVSEMLAQFEKWAEQTYEGRKLAAAVGIDTASDVPTGVKLSKIFSKSFGPVLANGLESFLTADQNGRLISYQSSGPTPMSTMNAPLRFSHLAQWATGEKIGLALNRNGEIAVFADGSLVFAKRRGNWHHFTFNAIIKRISLVNCFAPPLCKAVYQSCLDVSFAKTGGGIALIRRTCLPSGMPGSSPTPIGLRVKGQRVKPFDRWLPKNHFKHWIGG